MYQSENLGAGTLIPPSSDTLNTLVCFRRGVGIGRSVYVLGKWASTKTAYILSTDEWLGGAGPFLLSGFQAFPFSVGTCFPSAFPGDTFAILMLRSREFV